LAVRKIQIRLNNTIPLKVIGELGKINPAERTAECAVDPTNLNQVILAEGKQDEPNKSKQVLLNQNSN
jgi:hypothetical protein